MPRVPPLYYPRIVWYGILLCIAWSCGGVLGAAAVKFVAGMTLAALLVDLCYKGGAFNLHKEMSLGTMGTYMAVSAFASMYYFHSATADGDVYALEAGYMLALLVVDYPLVRFEHNRRVAQAKAAPPRSGQSSARWRPPRR